MSVCSKNLLNVTLLSIYLSIYPINPYRCTRWVHPTMDRPTAHKRPVQNNPRGAAGALAPPRSVADGSAARRAHGGRIDGGSLAAPMAERVVPVIGPS